MYKIIMLIGGTISQRDKTAFPNVTIYDALTFREAKEIARTLTEAKGVDAIIAPSGTAAAIDGYVTVPIVRSDPSRFDILQTLHYAEETTGLEGGRIALLLYKSRNIDLRAIQTFVKNELHLYTYENEEDIEGIVDRLDREVFPVMVGGPTALRLAEKKGIQSFLLRLSSESLRRSIDMATRFLEFAQKNREQRKLLETALNVFVDGVLITDEKGQVIESNVKANAILDMSQDDLLGQKVDELFHDPTCKDVYKGGMQQLDRIIDFQGRINLFSSRMPVIVDRAVKGAVITLQEATKIEKLEHEYRRYQAQGFIARYHFHDIVGASNAMKSTIEKAKAFSNVDSVVLIRGETGTGKELFSQSIHNYSHRKKGPFVAVNCAALPANLLESELMGYEEGAFTSAKRGGKAGLFELAHMGTLFLDEVTHIPIELQASILRVLQERQVLRIGGKRMIPINVRIIAATNEDLLDLIHEGRFRMDLYYRLNVLNLSIPPLRQRGSDITRLIQYYFDAFSRQHGQPPPLSEDAMRRLENYAWPGNIRELINCIERYVVLSRQLAESDIELIDEFLQAERPSSPVAMDNPVGDLQISLGNLDEMERQILKEVLKRYDGNKLQAALSLGISRTTLWKKLRDAPAKPVN
ncbi:MAG: sigma 54-interacting transcriptional regulator [Rhodospirillaceae bacterium]